MKAGIGLVLARSLPGQSEPQPAAGEEAAAVALWEQMIEAKGGRERLHGVETLVETMHFPLVFHNPKLKNGADHYVQAIAFPDRIWRWDDERPTVFGMSIWTTNLSTGFHYLVYPGNDVRKSTQLYGETVRLEDTQILLFNETRWVRPKPIRIRADKYIPRSVIALETQWNGLRWDFWISKKDYLPIRILHYTPTICDPKQNHFCHPEHIITSYNDLADYRLEDGIQIPHKSTPPNIIEARPLGFAEHTFILNPHLREDLFSTIPKSEDPSDAWKPREEWDK